MSGSQNGKIDIILTIYRSNRTVFRLNDVAILTGITNFQSLNRRVNYFVQTGKLLNPRKGIYAKPGYNPEELACSIFTPSYISLGYVLQKSGIIFQYDSAITSISYLSRELEIEEITYRYRKVKTDILLNTNGITREDNVNISIPERAFLDLFYLDKNYYFDNLNPLDKEKVFQLLPLYQSKSLTKRVNKLLKSD
jgi:hypothetical protein